MVGDDTSGDPLRKQRGIPTDSIRTPVNLGPNTP